MALPRTREQIQEFIRFFDVKRELFVSEMEAVFRDVQEARLIEDMYSKDDVEDIFTELLKAAKTTVRRDLESTSNMAALVLQQVLATTEDAGIVVPVDMARTEDEAALAKLKDLNAVFIADSDLKRKTGTIKLDSLRDEQQRTIAENARLTDELNATRQRLIALETALATKSREADEVTLERERLANELHATTLSLQARGRTTDDEATALRTRITRQESEIESLKAELERSEREKEAHITTSKPFAQMKAMLMKKNALVTELRRRLAVYEPDTTPVDTDDS